MNIKQSFSRDITILEISGRFDAYGAPNVADWLKRATSPPPGGMKGEKEGGARIVVDLTGVNFIDSTGLATLVQGMKHCREQGGDLFLSNLQKPARIIFELTRLDRAFRIFADQDAAVAAFQKKPVE